MRYNRPRKGKNAFRGCFLPWFALKSRIFCFFAPDYPLKRCRINLCLSLEKVYKIGLFISWKGAKRWLSWKEKSIRSYCDGKTKNKERLHCWLKAQGASARAISAINSRNRLQHPMCFTHQTWKCKTALCIFLYIWPLCFECRCPPSH